VGYALVDRSADGQQAVPGAAPVPEDLGTKERFFLLELGERAGRQLHGVTDLATQGFGDLPHHRL